MKAVGGNIVATVQCNAVTTNEIGEKVQVWQDVLDIKGFLDYSGGEYDYSRNSKMSDSTHVFICDYRILKQLVTGGKWKWDPLYLGTPDRTDTDYGDKIQENLLPEKIDIKPTNSRLVIDGVKYDVLFWDDPMEKHYHFEIYLRIEDGV